jgi:hypothetical protein
MVSRLCLRFPVERHEHQGDRVTLSCPPPPAPAHRGSVCSCRRPAAPSCWQPETQPFVRTQESEEPAVPRIWPPSRHVRLAAGERTGSGLAAAVRSRQRRGLRRSGGAPCNATPAAAIYYPTSFAPSPAWPATAPPPDEPTTIYPRSLLAGSDVGASMINFGAGALAGRESGTLRTIQRDTRATAGGMGEAREEVQLGWLPRRLQGTVARPCLRRRAGRAEGSVQAGRVQRRPAHRT